MDCSAIFIIGFSNASPNAFENSSIELETVCASIPAEIACDTVC